MQGKDTLALLPTGAGKSICYQVPAICLPGVCIVISPLIALMQDQVSRLKSLGVQAAAIYSGMHRSEMEAILSRARFGDLKLLYVSPERLVAKDFQEFIQNAPVSFIAVDEAHCISQWGHDFRPAYLKISKLREFSKAAILALTATATPRTRDEIILQLKQVQPSIFETSFRRENLSLLIYEEEQKMEALINFLKPIKESVIIYSRNRRQTVDLARMLVQAGFKADAYHAGMEASLRLQKQKDWIENKIQIIVATNAFGMGIDKSDVRLVMHLDLPQGLEEYFQEAGRAGRDREKAYAALLYNQQDIDRLKQNYIDSFPTEETIREIYRFLALQFEIPEGAVTMDSFDFDLVEFCKRFHLKPLICLNALKILEQNEFIVLTDAVSSPSRVQLIADREMLESYRQQDQKLDKLVMALLRNYEGIFSVAVQIQESSLASICQEDKQAILKMLQYLHSEQVLDYRPARNNPQILFLYSRMKSTDLRINKTNYKLQKERMWIRIESLLGFLQTPHCRQIFISSYFGQDSKEDCGICDNCLSKKMGKPDKELKMKWKELIRQYLGKKETMSYREILHLFPLNKRSWVEGIVEEMVAEQELVRQYEMLRLNR